jgi:hypothetical protein
VDRNARCISALTSTTLYYQQAACEQSWLARSVVIVNLARLQDSLSSTASSKLPRDVQRQVDAHRKAGGVQHLVELLREISVRNIQSCL